MVRDYINVVLEDLPCSIRGFVLRQDDYYTIVLNSRMSHDMQFKSYLHELEHIVERDFRYSNVDEIENIAHNRNSGDALRSIYGD